MFRTALILFLPATLLTAQGRFRSERPRALEGPRAEARREFRRDRLMARIHQLRMARIQLSLGVAEDKARTLSDRWADFDQDSMGRRQEMKRLREKVNNILVGPGSEEQKNTQVRPMVEQLTALQRQQQEAKRVFEEDIRASLTPAQQGRFMLLQEEFEKALQAAIAEQRKEKL